MESWSVRLEPSETFTLRQRKKGVMMILSRNGKVNEDGSFNWRDALIDAALATGLTFFTMAIAMVATGVIYTIEGQLTLIFTVGGQFFGFLAAKRGLPKSKS